MAKQTNYKTTMEFRTTNEIREAFSRRKNDILQATPGGSVTFSKSRVCLNLGVASTLLVDAVKGKKFEVDSEKVDNRCKTVVLKESSTGASFLKRSERNDFRVTIKDKKARAVFERCIPKSDIHPKSPKFELRIIDSEQTNGKTWIAVVPCERRRA